MFYVGVHTKRIPLEHSNVTAKVEYVVAQVESFSVPLSTNHQITNDLLPVTTPIGLSDILQLF